MLLQAFQNSDSVQLAREQPRCHQSESEITLSAHSHRRSPPLHLIPYSGDLQVRPTLSFRHSTSRNTGRIYCVVLIHSREPSNCCARHNWLLKTKLGYSTPPANIIISNRFLTVNPGEGETTQTHTYNEASVKKAGDCSVRSVEPTAPRR